MAKKIFLVFMLPFLILSILLDNYSLFKSARFIGERNIAYRIGASSNSTSTNWEESDMDYIDVYIGVCTGNYVRVRAAPNTSSEILGNVHKGDELALVNETKYGNQHWYEIINPFGTGLAWISAKYVRNTFETVRLNNSN